ncbi:MAG: hypothetical protein H0X45_04795 [Planctomycetes bacterium]|nr:hypothetical protein [Planctomycetota bacterium]
MRCACYRVDVPTLLAALSADEMIERYARNLADELPSLADRSLAQLLRRFARIAGQAMAGGFDALAASDRANADALLTDIFAVATWHRWEIPAESTGEQDLPVDELPRGLLGADVSTGGASLWLIDDQTVALARARAVDRAAVDEG